MSKIICSFFRNKKMNILYIFIFVLILVIISIFQIINDYYDYNISEKYGKNVEQRTYYILEEDKSKIEKLKKNFDFEIFKYDGYNSYTCTLRSYKDTKSLIKYFEKNSINGILDGSVNTEEIELLRKNQSIYNVMQKILYVISFIVFNFILSNIYLNNQKDIALLKIMGYRNFNILILLLIRIMIIILFSSILSIALFYFLDFGYIFLENSLLKSFLMQLNVFDLNFKGTIFLLCLALYDFTVNILKIKKIDVLSTLNSW